ncbi:copper-binding protein [Allopusillimonas ginsengisoli]|uniref:copper-binding protein n=1 Tax=Allopusillimonas ginsengisoli TaxID=453575 RepID=UPI0039C367C6
MSYSARQRMQALAAALAMTSFYAVPAMAQEATASGEVRRVDAAAGKITIKHGAISELDLPAMTLVYIADAKLLTKIKPGDKITFKAKRVNGQYVVTEISK